MVDLRFLDMQIPIVTLFSFIKVVNPDIFNRQKNKKHLKCFLSHTAGTRYDEDLDYWMVRIFLDSGLSELRYNQLEREVNFGTKYHRQHSPLT